MVLYTFDYYVKRYNSKYKGKDSFFENVTIFEKYFDFKNVAKSPHGLNAMDIARYILMLKPTTPLKLQKLLYIVYERYF